MSAALGFARRYVLLPSFFFFSLPLPPSPAHLDSVRDRTPPTRDQRKQLHSEGRRRLNC